MDSKIIRLIRQFIFGETAILCISVIIYFFLSERGSVLIFFLFSVSLISLLLWKISLYLNSLFQGMESAIDSISSPGIKGEFNPNQDSMISRLTSKIQRQKAILQFREDRFNSQRDEVASTISHISHQLKTPLTNLNIFRDLLTEEKAPGDELSEEERSFSSQIDRLNWLTDMLMKMSRLDNGLVNIQCRGQALDDTILEVIDSMFSQAQKKGKSITLEGKRGMIAFYDHRWLKEAVINIVDNGIKYSSSESAIRIKTCSDDSFHIIEIESEGNPVPLSTVNLIFTRFYRGEGNRESDGVGLGLYLARKILEAHGGYVFVKPLSEGNLFYLGLPIRPVENL